MSATAQPMESPGLLDQPPRNPSPLLAPRNELTWRGLTADQARILLLLVEENRASITLRWSPGIVDGLAESLRDVTLAGGAYLREFPP